MDVKLCDECKYKIASVHITQITKNEVSHLHLCHECAQEHGISTEILQKESAHEIEEMPKTEPGVDAEVTVQPDIICPGCLLTYSQYKEKGLLGCSNCYTAFSSEIEQLFLQMHGTARYKGKEYRFSIHSSSPEEELINLKRELDEAVKGERFEIAARLRDRIHELNHCGTISRPQPEEECI